MPVTYLNKRAMDNTFGMYIDELNLGNANELLQVSYGRILLSTERGIAGIQIPKFGANGTLEFKKDQKKRLWLSGSQNPSQDEDALFEGKPLSASMKNRFLILKYPSIYKSVCETMWLVEKENNMHERFLTEFKSRYEELTGTSDVIVPEELKEDWLSVYSFTMDSEKTEKALIRSTLEFSGALMLILGGDLDKTYQIEKDVVDTWRNKSLNNVTGRNNFSLRDSIQNTVEVDRLKEVLDPFNKPMTERDDAAMKSLADLFATLKNIKKAYQSNDPLKTFLSEKSYITVEDVAAGATLLARNKQMGEDPKDPLTTVNTVLKEYTGLMDALATKMNLKHYSRFKAENPNMGLKHSIYSTAVKEADNAEDIVSKINHYVGELKNCGNNSDFRTIIISRTVADLATVSGFILEHKDEIDKYLTTQKPQKGSEIRKFVKELYVKEKRNPAIDPIYSHRLPRVL